MKAIILAGGFGSRLYPLTIFDPKPMIPLVNKPVLSHIFDLLKRHHFSEVILTVQHLNDRIRNYFGDGRHLGLKLRYVTEDTPLGTAGSVKNAQPYLNGETCLVMCGDILTNLDLSSLVDYHHARQATVTMALKHVVDPKQYGLVVTNESGRIQQFVEKPDRTEMISNLVNTGVYVLEPEALDAFRPNTVFDFSYDLFPLLLKQAKPMFGYLTADYWRDVGTLKNYRHATFDMLAGQVNHVELGSQIGPGIWAGGEVEIAPTARLQGPVFLGNGVKIHEGAVIQGPVVLGDHTIVDCWAQVEQSLIGRNSYVGISVDIRRSLLPPLSNLAEEVSPRRRRSGAAPVVEHFAPVAF